MSRSIGDKESKRINWPLKASESKAIDKSIRGTGWGSTHRIRRRNRKAWSRRTGKARRALDKEVIKSNIE